MNQLVESVVEIQIMFLPCGCASDAEILRADEDDYLTCPWCDAVFFGPEFRKWFKSKQRPRVYVQQAPRILLRIGKKVLEIVDVCGDCESPRVRERGAKDLMHLSELPHAIRLPN